MTDLDYAFTLLRPFEMWEWGVISIAMIFGAMYFWTDRL